MSLRPIGAAQETSGSGPATRRSVEEQRFREIRFLHAARLIVTATALGLAGITGPEGEQVPVPWLALLFLTQVAATWAGSIALQRSSKPGTLLTIGFLVDAAFVTTLVVHTGGVLSPYSLLYLFPIVGAGTLQGMGGGVTLSVVSSAAYLVTAFLGADSIFSWLGVSPLEDVQFLWAFARLSFYPIFFVCVGALAGFVGDRSREAGAALAAARHELERMQVSTDAIVENLTSGLLTVDGEGRIIQMNRMAEEMTGLSQKDVRGKPFEEALGPGGAELAEKIRTAFVERKGESRREVRFRVPGSAPALLGVSTSLLRTDGSGIAGVIALFQDLTGIRKAEERERRQDRLAAIGELATGIAHEIRNCLNPIVGSVELLEREVPLSDDNKKLMELIQKETETLDGFVRQLLSYARGRPLHIVETDVKRFLDEAVSLVRNHPLARNRVRFRIEAPEDRVTAPVDEEQMRQVLLNLCLNAIEAMPSGGDVLLRVARVAPGTAEKDGGSEEGIQIEVRDTGTGISESVLAHVFEPFYSTKGGGTGMGLPIAHRIVEKHGGRLLVESTAGAGTSIRVFLPAEPPPPEVDELREAA